MGYLGAGTMSAVSGPRPAWSAKPFRIRTITAGITLDRASDPGPMKAAIQFLSAARARLEDDHEIQTTRIATSPLAGYLPAWKRPASLDAIRRLDDVSADAGVSLSIGPVLIDDEQITGFGSWAAALLQATRNTSFSSFIASEGKGIHRAAIRSVAEAVASIAAATPGGEGNFRFCGTAFCPPGTPFFPAAYHSGTAAFSIGLESPRLLLAALEGGLGRDEAENSMRSHLDAALAAIEARARQIAGETGWRYLGIDTSPAPGLDSSIGQVVETLTGKPFGAPATLWACATITDVLQSVTARTCGYSGLMLPVLEDRVLAARAREGRFGVDELLLYSSVCGTGLDVVPLPGDTPVDSLAALIGDVAALASRYRKPLSARLFPIPGKRAGDTVSFENPYLTASTVMALE